MVLLYAASLPSSALAVAVVAEEVPHQFLGVGDALRVLRAVLRRPVLVVDRGPRVPCRSSASVTVMVISRASQNSQAPLSSG